jgi:hypothetical protein
MDVFVSYDEVIGLIKKSFNISLKIENVDETTVKVSYSPHKLIPEVNVDVQVLSATENAVRLVYDSSLAVEKLIEGAIFFVRDRIPADQIEIDTDKASIVLFLSKSKNIKEIFKFASLRDLRFTERGVELDMRLK